MTMEDWAKQLDRFLELTERGILQDAGRISAEAAELHAESEFEKYRLTQDRISNPTSTAWCRQARRWQNRANPHSGRSKKP